MDLRSNPDYDVPQIARNPRPRTLSLCRPSGTLIDAGLRVSLPPVRLPRPVPTLPDARS
jgi:hypothetical protein